MTSDLSGEVGLVCGLKCGIFDSIQVLSVRVDVGPPTPIRTCQGHGQCTIASWSYRAADTE